MYLDWYKDEKTGMPNSIFYSPYSNTLQNLILEDFKIEENQLNVTAKGVPGQCAINMIKRLNKCLTENNKVTYDLVLILAGTNDIALVKDTQKIIDKIIEMHEICKKNGTKSIAITIPESEKQNDKAIQKRNKINNAIKAFANENGIDIFDLYDKFKFHSLNKEQKELYWNDGLHFTPKGYEHFGQMLYQFLKSYLEQLYKQKFVDIDGK